MTTPFFIMALPRSRTSWLANWFCWGESFCLHDGMRLGMHPMKRILMARGERYSGNADSSIGFRFDDYLEQFPDARFLLVERPLEDVVTSIRANLKWMPTPVEAGVEQVRLLHERHEEIKRHINPSRLRVEPHTFMENHGSLRHVQSWLIPGAHADFVRWNALHQMNIQPEPSAYWIPPGETR